MSALELKVYDLLKARFTEAEASLIVEFVEAKAEEKAKAAVQKGEDVSKSVEKLVNKDIENLPSEMYRVFATKEDLARQIGEAKADIIKWMFIFWIGQIAATIAMVLIFVRK